MKILITEDDARKTDEIKAYIRSLDVSDEEIVGDRPTKMTAPQLATFTSGSAVIASDTLIAQVATYHRKVSGLDMEVYAIHRAAEISQYSPKVICAKTVVDLATGEKDDKLQPYGCYISAKFVVEAISAYFNG